MIRTYICTIEVVAICILRFIQEKTIDSYPSKVNTKKPAFQYSPKIYFGQRKHKPSCSYFLQRLTTILAIFRINRYAFSTTSAET